MTEENVGSVEMVIDQQDGKVVQRFKRPMEVVVYEPNNAIDVAMAMTDAAFAARDGVKPVGSTLKAELVERHRVTLTTRVALMLGSLRGDKLKSDGQVAQAVVEAMLREVF